MAGTGGGKVNFRNRDVLMKVKRATKTGMVALAHQIVGVAKTNIVANDQIDTGFMLNSGYVVGADGTDTYVGGDERMAPEAPLQDADAMVGWGARYSIFQELLQSFLGSALLQVAGEAGGTLSSVYRSEVHD